MPLTYVAAIILVKFRFEISEDFDEFDQHISEAFDSEITNDFL